MTRAEILETAAVALALGGSMADWPARFVFHVLEELNTGSAGDTDRPPDQTTSIDP